MMAVSAKRCQSRNCSLNCIPTLYRVTTPIHLAIDAVFCDSFPPFPQLVRPFKEEGQMETAFTIAPASPIRFWREWEFWILAALTAAIYFSRIADLTIRGEETRRAMVAAEILRSGDWIVPRPQGAPFLSRPPVASWAIVWFARLVGDLNLASVRLPTVIATLLTTLLVYAYSSLF